MAKERVSPLQKALNLWAIILIMWSIYRANFKLPEWFDEFIAKPLVFVLPVIYYILRVERKKITEGLWIDKKKLLPDLLIAIFVGIVFFLTALLANFFKFNKIIFLDNFDYSQNLLIIILTALATATSEEILSRGFILKRLYEDSKNILTSSFFASILFFFLHVPILFTNLNLTGNLLLFFMLTDIILSLFNSFIFLTRKSLFLPIFIHALYNFTLVFFLY